MPTVLMVGARMFAITTPNLNLWGLVEVVVTAGATWNARPRSRAPVSAPWHEPEIREIEL
ncbi:hypothetical protein [Actinomadura sp. 7K507]|uniref:hypothetical protein n=1 Tax=Actinomadura sp. 7K507 TaxID=2530365 RepID=UPI001052D8AF|nr:hypothetical protein [Actinomadura sp. 7K507]TDC73057.1 hypothetical protein E1285_44880 [Actinomadura sp. 7K507]